MIPRASRPRNIFFFLAFVLAVPAGNAAGDGGDEPIRINARHVEANDKTGAVVYSGDVVVGQGRLSIRADRIEVQSSKGKSVLIRATGKPVKLRQAPEGNLAEVHAEAGLLEYHVPLRRIELTGQVKLRRGDDLFSADRLNYDLVSKNLSATGNDKGDGRVHAVIQPKKPESGETPSPPMIRP